MGILDEAIREHLDLKRRQGAGEDEIQRLKDEAFGPPSRPGDPDFPAPAEQAEATTGEQEVEPGTQAPAAVEALPADAQAAPAPEAPVEEPSVEEPAGETAASAEVAEGERPDFFDAESETAAEPAPESAAAPSEDLELDLDLDVEEEIERVGDLDVEETEPAVSSGADAPPISSLDTVEHHFEDALDEADVVADEPAADEPAQSAEPADPEASEEDGEDVLEETPEFLQDTPEDDELWFEQGEPKDFDF